MDRSLNESRNHYLLTIRAANALNESYYRDWIGQIIQKFDQHSYTQLASIFNEIIRGGKPLSKKLEQEIKKARNLDNQINASKLVMDRETNLSLYVLENPPVFAVPLKFELEPCGTDLLKEIIVDPMTMDGNVLLTHPC